jgi:hypothetical protein
MDVGRNHLVADIESVPEKMRGRYTEVPEALREAAKEELAGRPDVFVSPAKQSELVDWARNKRKKLRAKAKVAKQSRKRNRK